MLTGELGHASILLLISASVVLGQLSALVLEDEFPQNYENGSANKLCVY